MQVIDNRKKEKKVSIQIISEIELKVNLFYFEGKESAIYMGEQIHCSCDYVLDSKYVYIIKALQEAGLLSEDYVEECCYCKDRRKRIGDIKFQRLQRTS